MRNMKRRTKAPEARKEQFVRTAGRLFERKGYENTSVDDIVRAMGVAKGLFYYYFRSKDDVLELIIDRLVRESVRIVEDAASREGLDAPGKFREFMSAAQEARVRSRKLVVFLHSEANRHLHADIESRTVRLMLPSMTRIIRQGVAEGVFRTEYPEETALALFAVSSILGHEVYQRPDPAFFRRRVEAALSIMERLLGAAPGTFDFYLEGVPDGARLKRWLGSLRTAGGKGHGGKGGRSG